eukprot:CAMPEP_0172330228 /NCGR_PEP_ID=MMETSP1058-20130122/61292_1 /TAXON_ID=83371 /ORGANISM="Detonula confervacea, Strain CCMP 353" /LENGTH=237 /DNA_ID=CAMNT_0013047433 /DNA_START=1053 /DNA_END=1763 /DNA_ORIENTATION=+
MACTTCHKAKKKCEYAPGRIGSQLMSAFLINHGKVVGFWLPKVNVMEKMTRKDRALVFSDLRILALLTLIRIHCFLRRRIVGKTIHRRLWLLAVVVVLVVVVVGRSLFEDSGSPDFDSDSLLSPKDDSRVDNLLTHNDHGVYRGMDLVNEQASIASDFAASNTFTRLTTPTSGGRYFFTVGSANNLVASKAVNRLKLPTEGRCTFLESTCMVNLRQSCSGVVAVIQVDQDSPWKRMM